MKYVMAVVALASLMLAGAPARAQGIDYAKVEILTQQGIGVLVGPDGVLMVDAQYAPLTEKVLAAIRKLSDAPIRFLVDTHEHPDHTGGNANFAKLGALILAREETMRSWRRCRRRRCRPRSETRPPSPIQHGFRS